MSAAAKELARAAGGSAETSCVMGRDSSAVGSGAARSVLANRGDGVRGDRLASSNGIHAFVGLGFEVDFVCGEAERLRQCRAHCRKVRAELGAFADDNGVYMNDAKAAIVKHLGNALEENQAGRPLPLRIGVREVRADVAQIRGAKKRIAERVAQHVAIGVALGAFVERNFDAADHELAAFDEAVKIVTDSGEGHPMGPLDGLSAGGCFRIALRCLIMKIHTPTINRIGEKLISVLIKFVSLISATSTVAPCFRSRSVK